MSIDLRSLGNARRSLKVFFDVDDTLITWDGRLRPGVEQTLARLHEDGHQLFVWSGAGIRWHEVRRFQLERWIADCFLKPTFSHHERLPELGIPFVPDFVVDDHLEVVLAFGGTQIARPCIPLEADTEMARVYREIASFAREGRAGK